LAAGGDIEDMKLILKPHALELVESLTNYDNEEPIKKLKYQEFYKITYKSLKETETSLLPQDAMKRISILWKEYKKSFEEIPQSLQET
jgi:hypothetical protein